jgi:four helix bundle protein
VLDRVKAASLRSRRLRRCGFAALTRSPDPVSAHEAVDRRERKARSERINMSFDVERVSYELIAALRPLLTRVQRRDRGLAVQLTRAASSICLNVSEANYSDPGNRRARFFTAAGSANETRAALRVALGWGYVGHEHAAPALALLDRVLAMLWKLTR